ncbi:MAG: glycosyltransferase family 2 protein [Deltaproteobacteria bacterium]|nr:glycosyltransferase family 2 protein [Deltaproteobacteria bacterium]
MTTTSVDLIIPNWNGSDLLTAYLPSVCAAAKAYPGPAQVILVDDASSDDSLAMLKRDFPDVRVIAHERNLGFGKACGSGALASQADTLIFLNSDVEVSENFIAPLLAPLENPDNFSTVPLILEEDERPARNLITIPYLRRGKIRYRTLDANTLQEHEGRNSEPWYTLFPVGCAFAVRREKFMDIGGFDELFEPFYYEDTDLGLCAWRRGWTIQVIPSSRVWHKHRGTIARSFAPVRVKSIRKRNRHLYQIKNMTSAKLLWSYLAQHSIRTLTDLVMLKPLTLVASVIAIPRLAMSLRSRRREIRASERSIAEIFSVINTAWIANQDALRTSDPTNSGTSSPASQL